MEVRPDTALIRGGLLRSEFDETAEGLYLTSGYVYSSAEEAEAAFAGEKDRYIYSRYGNPTVSMFEERLRLLEGAEACIATSTGMAAVFWSLAASVAQGDRVVAAKDLFGSCFIILSEFLPRWGVETVFVDGTDIDGWRKALSEPATAVFFETPSNPMQTLIDVAAVSELAHDAGAHVIVDNVFATPILQKPLELGADIVVYSATKHIDGQGRTLGGAVLGSSDFIFERLQPFTRHTGPALSPFNAWVLVKAIETLPLRVEKQSRNANEVARWLEKHDRVKRVLYPGIDSHPQSELARRQMLSGGTVVTFEIDGGKEGAFRLLNALRVVDISNNLGDTKSLITHPATTTHRRIGPDGRARMGITDGIIRVSIGLEDPADVQEDLAKGLAEI